MSRGVFKAHRNVKNLRSYLNLTICVTNRKKIPEKPSFRRGDSYRKVSKNPKAFKFVHKGIYLRGYLVSTGKPFRNFYEAQT